MLRSPRPDRPSRRLLTAGLVVAMALAFVGVVLALNSGDPSPPTPSARVPWQPAVRSPALEVATDLQQVERSADPAVFARSVALALFSWDTASRLSPSGYSGRILAITAAEESAGLASDLGNYLPRSAVWPTLREYRTRQWLEVTSVAVPVLWAQAVDEAGPDGLAPGTTAYTIEGVRHRAGIWEGAPVTAADEVSFTVFIVCAPTYPTCHLLRLSLPGKPLR